jgi:hypothetical protein
VTSWIGTLIAGAASVLIVSNRASSIPRTALFAVLALGLAMALVGLLTE